MKLYEKIFKSFPRCLKILRAHNPSLELKKENIIKHFLIQKLRLDAWFPHIPLALAILLLACLQMFPFIDNSIGDFFSKFTKDGIRINLPELNGLPGFIPGIFLFVMSIGIILRSHLAWYIVCIFLFISMLIVLLLNSLSSHYVIFIYNAILLFLLILFHKKFYKSSVAVATIFSLTSVIMLFTYAILGSFYFGNDFSPKINDLYSAIYFSIVTMATVGYGDIVPKTPEARLFTSSIIIFGITIFATSLSAIIVPLVNNNLQRLIKKKDKSMDKPVRYIIVGDSALAKNTYKKFKKNNESIKVILPEIPHDNFFSDEDIVVGDGCDIEVLNKAGAKDAEAILALSDNDSENAFVVLAAKELESKPNTAVGVNHVNNLARVKRVKPDIIISPQILGAEIIAGLLQGEKLDSDSIIKNILQHIEIMNQA